MSLEAVEEVKRLSLEAVEVKPLSLEAVEKVKYFSLEAVEFSFSLCWSYLRGWKKWSMKQWRKSSWLLV